MPHHGLGALPERLASALAPTLSCAKREKRENHMRSPYGLDIIENCLTCPVREERLFCNLTVPAIKALQNITSTAAYPKSAVLFVEGQNPRGIFILCSGKAKLSTSSADGKTLILKIAEPGEVLGLSATVSGKPYEVTVEVLEPAQANFVQRDAFLKFLAEHGEAALRVAQQLSSSYHSAYEEIRSLGLSHSAVEKLARLLLEWSKDENGGGPVRMKLTLTHEEIAQMIGASRETVTRAFGELKKKQLVQVKGATVVIRSRQALEKLVTP
jgi:CRP/FNR family transcriptional regulator